jgi:hypothetical protein
MTVSGNDIIDFARTALGVSYKWGGTDMRSGIDCSGLVQAVYGHYGIHLPRVTYDQINTGASVPVDRLQAGDLVFFDTDKKTAGPDHVGIYIGGGKFIHAPRTGDVVKISSLTDSFYMNRWMGGRRVAGVAGYSESDAYASGGQAAAQGPPEVRLSAEELADEYGMSYAFFKSQPELMKLLKSAVADTWDDGRFQAELKNTAWWKNNSESARKAQVQSKTDPATYKASIAAAQAAASAAAVASGAILGARQVQQLAKNIVDYGWNDAQVTNYLGQYVGFQKDHTLGGQAGAAARQIRQYAHEQGVRISDQTLKNHAAYLVRGISTMEQIQGSLRQQAMSTYPGWSEQLAAGATVRDLAQPYIQMTAQQLELPESDVDVWHPRVRAALQAQDAKGQPAPMPLGDYQGLLRADPAWRRTQGAQDQAMGTGRQVLAQMGLIA